MFFLQGLKDSESNQVNDSHEFFWHVAFHLIKCSVVESSEILPIFQRDALLAEFGAIL